MLPSVSQITKSYSSIRKLLTLCAMVLLSIAALLAVSQGAMSRFRPHHSPSQLGRSVFTCVAYALPAGVVRHASSLSWECSDTILYAISASSSTNVWAVGVQNIEGAYMPTDTALGRQLVELLYLVPNMTSPVFME